MKRIDRKRLEALSKVRDLSEVLTWDLNLASERFFKEALQWSPKEGIDWGIAFIAKTAVRACLSQVDGLTYAMRQAVVELGPELGVKLEEKEKLKLQELRRTKQGQIVKANLSPAESLKLAFRYYPSLFGILFPLDLDRADNGYWRAFLALVDARNGFTHPKILEDLGGKDVYRFFQPAMLWFLTRFSQMLNACARAIEGSGLCMETHELPPFQFPEDRQVIFSKDDYDKIRADPSWTLEYVKQAVFVLMEDTSRALSLSSELSDEDSLLGPHGQFGLRNFVRTFHSEVEGTVAFAEFFIQASLHRKEFEPLEEDHESLEGDLEIDEKLARVLNLWSREFSHGNDFQTGGPKWQAFRRAKLIRNRLTHPRSVRDLRVSLEDMDTIFAAQDWFRKVTDLMYLGEEWVQKARSLERSFNSGEDHRAHE